MRGNSTKGGLGARLAALALAFAFCISACIGSGASVGAASAEGEQVSRLIYVVYDDSNSMLMEASTAWSQAKYSLEIFASMLQENDVMSVYFMSQFTDYYLEKEDVTPVLDGLSGKETNKKGNIDKIHKAVTKTWGTPIESIEYVYGKLKEEVGKYDECHMVVLTDGSTFHVNGVEDYDTTESQNRLDGTFENCKDDGVNVIYLAIGGRTLTPNTKKNGDILVCKALPNSASGITSILYQVTEICKHIFQRPAHDTSGNTLDLKIPVSEIIIFAQGADVSIGDIEGAKKSTVSAGIDPVNDKDKATTNPLYPPKDIFVAKGLFGSVATFKPAEGAYIAEGEYELDVTATSYTVYYKPYLDVELKLVDKNGNTAEGSTVPAGTYRAEYYLTYPDGHPQAGKPVNTDGLFTPEYTLSVNGTEHGSDEIDLEVGKTEVTVTAKYLTYIATDTSLKLTVEEPKAQKLSVKLSPDSTKQNLSDFISGDGVESFTAEVTRADGSLLSSEEWSGCYLGDESLSGTGLSEGLDFDVVKNTDGKTFTLTPRFKNGSRADTATGTVPFTAAVAVKDIEDGSMLYEGEDSGTVEIYDDIANSALKVEVIGVTPDLMSDTFNDSAPKVTVRISWNGNPLTKAQYDALELMPEATSTFLAKDENGLDVPLLSVSGFELSEFSEGEHTTAVVSFVAKGDAETQRIELDENDGFKIVAKMTLDGEETLGETSGELDVSRKYTPEEIGWFVFWIIIILFFLLGYVICKRYLPRKIKVISHNGSIVTNRPYRKLGTIVSVLIPFRNVRGKLRVSYEDRNGYSKVVFLRIKAQGPLFGLPKSGAPYAVITNATNLYRDMGVYTDNRQNELQRYLDDVAQNLPTSKPIIDFDYTNSSVNDVQMYTTAAQFVLR